MAAAFSDSFATHFVDGAREDAGSVRSAADIFTLLSDNIQATVLQIAAYTNYWDGCKDNAFISTIIDFGPGIDSFHIGHVVYPSGILEFGPVPETSHQHASRIGDRQIHNLD